MHERGLHTIISPCLAKVLRRQLSSSSFKLTSPQIFPARGMDMLHRDQQ